MSVEKLIQDDLFGDTFTSVPTHASGFSPRRLKQMSAPSLALRLPPNLPEFRVIRSSRRKKSINAFRNKGLIEIHIPDRMTRRQEFELIPEMIQRVLDREARSRLSNQELDLLAAKLLESYLPELHERPSSIMWRPMRERWGSCTTTDRTIRIAQRLAGAPEYVINCVLLHELIHLRIPGHGADFYEYLARYPELARAEAFLEGFEAAIAAEPDNEPHLEGSIHL